jgi:acyl-CoA synthetase (AMP-forming)/AMP-acid ligase II
MLPTTRPRLAVPDYIDEAAKAEPNAVWALIPRSGSSLDQVWHNITYAQLASAVDNLAQSLEDTLGVPNSIGQTIGYIG